MHSLYQLAFLLGRICLGLVFILAGSDKFAHPEATAAYMTAKGMTMVPFFMYGAALVELIGGLSLILGFKARWGATLLTLFLIAVSVIIHNFWNEEGSAAAIDKINFMKNVGIIGGLLYVIGCGAGSLSIDGVCRGKKH
jgi:putative oxidoreductase